MAAFLKLSILIISILASFSTSATMTTTFEQASPSLPPPPSPAHTDSTFSASHLFEPILNHFGFQELAMAVPSLTSTSWTGPITIFAPSDTSIHTCTSCSIPRLLQEHIVPGVFSLHYLRSLAFGTKIETIVPGRCITVTSALNSSKIFVGGVEITRPDLFNNGFFVVHGLDGFVSHLSPLSCNIERMTSLSFPPQPSERTQSQTLSRYSVMRMMITDAVLRLRITGFSILALAMRVKYAELVNLQSMTIFTLDDVSIFSGGFAYVSNVRFHIVPNRLLMIADLESLPVGTVLPTLEEGQKLVVTTAGSIATPMRINYVRIKSPDVMHNLKIVVHSLFLPFPHVHPSAVSLGGVQRSGWNADDSEILVSGDQVAPTPEIESTAEIEDYHGL